MSPVPPRPHAFTIIEMVIAITLLGGVTAAMAATCAQVSRAKQTLAARRMLLRAAEEALAERQAGVTPWYPAGVSVSLVPATQPVDWNPAAGVWVEAVATDGQHTERLMGVVPNQQEGGRP